MTCSYFIYYRAAGDENALRAAVDAMQQAVAQETGVPGRLMRRADDPTTWMEVYEPVPDARRFERSLAAAVARFEIDRLLATGAQRHIERFVAVR